jgi:hypothetical protein
MTETTKQQSNPFSTGGGGVNFETRVQAAFTLLMLTRKFSPCLPNFPITKIILQGHYAGFNTDDFIIFAEQPDTLKKVKLLAQIKHDINITEKDKTFAEVIQSTWNDFNHEDFDYKSDALALITGPLSKTDINDVRPILEWSRYCENEEEFLNKINTANFSSNGKRNKLKAFRSQLKSANDGIDVSNEQLWKFLKVFYLIDYDLDTESGVTLSFLYSLIAQYSSENAKNLWARIVDAVQVANQNAGTITLETLPEDIQTAFSDVCFTNWSSDVKKLKDYGNSILERLSNSIGDIHIKRSEEFAELLNLSETSRFVLIAGERGAGKSSLIKEFSDYLDGRIPVFCLLTEHLDKSHLDQVFSSIGLKGTLREIEAGFSLIPKKFLIIESLEKLLELDNKSAFLDLLHLLDKQKSWTVIATVRDYAYQQIAFNFLQNYKINYAKFDLKGFNKEQIQYLCEQIQGLQHFANNPTLRLLLKIPFFAYLAYKVVQSETELPPNAGEKEFRVAVWENVIKNEEDRKNGMPLKRKMAFVNIAVNRAKRMVYGVSENNFDSEALFKLEEDSLIFRKDGLVSPAHDILEDLALDQYIEDIYQNHSGDIEFFLNTIGNEPAINRAFRLWLHQKLRYGENVDNVVISVLSNQNIQRYWQDETIVAVLQGDNPDDFLRLLKKQLFLKNGDLLKRFCFILRIACKIPDSDINSKFSDSDEATLSNVFLLKPYGQVWDAIICFLLENKDDLSNDFIPHIIAVLDDWSSLLNLNDDLPEPAREVGLLALHLLNLLKEMYRTDHDRKKIISIMIKTIPAIKKEFLYLLKTDIFQKKVKLTYVEEFYKMAFQKKPETDYFSKYAPDELIQLAYSEWLLEKNKSVNRYQSSGVDNYFRLHEYKYNFSPASGAKGPFKFLLQFHPRKGLDFILNLLNLSAEEYAQSNLDKNVVESVTQNHPLISTIGSLTIELDDGTKVQQYYSSRLWFAYRGHSIVPNLLQCALMALENWLIEVIESWEIFDIKRIFDYILKQSNSVMPTAILASIATGFPEKIGQFAFPILQIPEFYHLDSQRQIQERINNRDWHRSSFRQDGYSKYYSQERLTAHQRPWRQEDLEMLVIRLQFSEWRQKALDAIDVLQSSTVQDEATRFLLHRIDSRGWKAVEDKTNNRILFEAENLEPDLQDLQQKTQENLMRQNRFYSLYFWAIKAFKEKQFEIQYYPTWQEALVEAKAIFEEFNSNLGNELETMSLDAVVIAAVVFIRDFSQQMGDGDIEWCIEVISQAMTSNELYDNKREKIASILPIMFDFVLDEDEKCFIKKIIAFFLTHDNESVRDKAADGVKNYLWERDSEFAQKCIFFSIEYASYLQKNRHKIARLYWDESDIGATQLASLQQERESLIERYIQNEISIYYQSFSNKTHVIDYVLLSCLMIPSGSTDNLHIELLSDFLAFLCDAEGANNDDNDLELNYEIEQKFTSHFSQYLFHFYSDDNSFQPYLDYLKIGCETAPRFIDGLMSNLAITSESENKPEIYWQLWKELSPEVQQIAITIADNDDKYDNYGQQDGRISLIREILYYENRDMILGKELLLEFVANAGQNPHVFEALASLIYHFPSIFFDEGIPILSKYQQEKGGTRLFSGRNTIFYLEVTIHRFLLNHSGYLPRNIHESCLTLLNGIVETASSRAYYLREQLIRFHKINN